MIGDEKNKTRQQCNFIACITCRDKINCLPDWKLWFKQIN